jgi:hypothetical protein
MTVFFYDWLDEDAYLRKTPGGSFDLSGVGFQSGLMLLNKEEMWRIVRNLG